MTNKKKVKPNYKQKQKIASTKTITQNHKPIPKQIKKGDCVLTRDEYIKDRGQNKNKNTTKAVGKDIHTDKDSISLYRRTIAVIIGIEERLGLMKIHDKAKPYTKPIPNDKKGRHYEPTILTKDDNDNFIKIDGKKFRAGAEVDKVSPSQANKMLQGALSNSSNKVNKKQNNRIQEINKSKK